MRKLLAITAIFLALVTACRKQNTDINLVDIKFKVERTEKIRELEKTALTYSYVAGFVHELEYSDDFKSLTEDEYSYLVKFLIENKKPIYGGKSALENPLCTASRKNFYRLATYLLNTDCKDSINYKGDSYAPSIFFSILHDNEKLTRLLLENGANLDFKTADQMNMYEAMQMLKDEYPSDWIPKYEKILNEYGLSLLKN